MSTVTVSLGRARSSSHPHERRSSTAPSMVKLHRSSGRFGVGPADRTGKSFTTYCPGGTRDGSMSVRRRPRKPREIGAIAPPPLETMPSDEAAPARLRARAATLRPMLGLPRSVAACLFDLDGVLTMTAKVHAAAWKEMFDGFLAQRASQRGE